MNRTRAVLMMLILMLFYCTTIGLCDHKDIKNDEASLNYDCGCSLYGFSDSELNEAYMVMQHPIIVDSSISYYNTSQIQTSALPASFSWKDIEGVDWTTPAKHQKNCGSCWDFAALGSLEATIKIEEECPSLNPDLSEQYVLSCLPAAANTYGKGCWGGNPSAALYYIFDNGPDGNNHNGIILESCFPYQASHAISCDDKCAEWQDYIVPLKNTSELWLGFDSFENREIIKNQIFHNGPVAAAMNVTEEFTRYWQLHHKETDYFPDPHAPWGEMLNHIIVIIGWKDDPSITNGGYWICKNSWGTDWGYDGFYNIEYGALFTGYLITWGEYDAAAFNWPPSANPGPYRAAQRNEEIIFDGSQSIDPEGEIISYHWDFGDGFTATGILVNHSYQQPGIYLVNLTVTDSSNKTGTKTTIVGIEETPFKISFKSGLGMTIKILNLLDFQHQDVTWSAELKGLVFAQKTNGYIYQINIDQEKKIVLIAMGIGPGKITFECNGFSAATWFIILGPLIFMLG